MLCEDPPIDAPAAPTTELVPSPPAPSPPAAVPLLRRSPDERLVAGVCGGLEERFGVSVAALRIATALATLVAGLGVMLYVVAWVFLPRRDETESIAARVRRNRRDLVVTVVVGAVAVLVAAALQSTKAPAVGSVVWPALVALVGVVAVWRGASEAERTYLHSLLEVTPGQSSPRSVLALRAIGGMVLGILGLIGLADIARPNGADLLAVLSALSLLTGCLLIFGPWWLRLVREVTEERRERVRAEERADMAAHVHDSVLQTLALIQKAASDPSKVTRLARAQERDLRSWLFEGRQLGSLDGDPTRLDVAVAGIVREVEDSHDVVIESIVVGDCPLDDRLRCLLAAGREAIVNAAKWSEAPVVSVFVEVQPLSVTMFVRDRGVGFDPASVPEGRKGIAVSICERMERQGGRVRLQSSPDFGTEFELVMPREVASR